ncbi:hypothetical protein BJ508DRAFT_97025 [Ascobolus immersus RN42]|uniref:Uncharacterized protein n=1 Tax=Ascobolus immersus RN42 TaxID=1160509 RepID=A0A3N4IP14_ASCIM|nr:hypothetical protein BJ508DRAFT_97025 [Ascobolus immersus RN42]
MYINPIYWLMVTPARYRATRERVYPGCRIGTILDLRPTSARMALTGAVDLPGGLICMYIHTLRMYYASLIFPSHLPECNTAMIFHRLPACSEALHFSAILASFTIWVRKSDFFKRQLVSDDVRTSSKHISRTIYAWWIYRNRLAVLIREADFSRFAVWSTSSSAMHSSTCYQTNIYPQRIISIRYC